MHQWAFRVFAAPALTVGVMGTSACTSLLGDFASGSEGGGDAGAERDAPSAPSVPDASIEASGGDDSATPPGVLPIAATDLAVYIGQTAAPTAATTSGTATFDWTVTSVPASSAVTTTSLSGAATASPSFAPDAPGDYVLHVVAREGGASGSRDVHVTAARATVFYARYEEPAIGSADAAAPSTEAFYAAGADGTGPRAITCPTTVANSFDPYSAGVAFDFWEPAPGKPYAFAAFYPTVGDGGYGQVQLVVGTSDSTCASPPVAVGTYDQTLAGLQPSFSRDGSRFAFYDDTMKIVTIGSDGTDAHAVTSYLASEPDGSTPIYDVGADSDSTPPRLQWTATGSLAWARSTATGWQIVTAPDQDGAPVTVYMDCVGVTPHQIAMLSDGTVIAAYRPDGPDGAENLYRLKLDAAKDCAVVHAYTAVSFSDAGVAGYATDFSVSPDEKQIVYEAVDPASQSTDPWQSGGYPGGYLYVAAVDGSSPPIPITSDPSLDGPRWIAGGSAIAYTRIDTNPYRTTQQFGNLIRLINHPPSTSVRVMAAAGGASRIIDHGDGTAVAVATPGNGGSCSMGRGTAPGAAGLFALVAAGALARRRNLRR
jgi:hypothetical protein